MIRSHGVPGRLLLATIVATAMVACGGSDSDSSSAEPEPEGTVAGSDASPVEAASGEAPDATAVEACLEAAGLRVRNEDEVDSFYSDEELDFFDLDTALLVEGGDPEFISGTINFYRTIETAETQEQTFEESVTDYTVGRTGTVVYTLVGGTEGGELPTVTDTIDRCLAES